MAGQSVELQDDILRHDIWLKRFVANIARQVWNISYINVISQDNDLLSYFKKKQVRQDTPVI